MQDFYADRFGVINFPAGACQPVAQPRTSSRRPGRAISCHFTH